MTLEQEAIITGGTFLWVSIELYTQVEKEKTPKDALLRKELWGVYCHRWVMH